MGKYDLNSLLKELDKTDSSLNNTDFQSDFWKPTIDKAEERVEYVIRFLPNPDTKTGFPWVERAVHMFQFGNGKFIYEPCVKKAKKQPCFICEEVAKLYESEDPAQEAIGSKRFSRKRFFHNVLIISDPREGGKNEGRVMIYEAGSQIQDKCVEFLRSPGLPEEERIYFHPTEGTDFRLVLTWKQKYPNYEKSDFQRKMSPISIDGKVLSFEEAEQFIEKNAKKLNERLLVDKVFKDYETLKNLYLNQGQVDETKTKTRNPEKKEKEEEEINADIDQTINKKNVTSRNPMKKVEPEVEEDNEPFNSDNYTDEDAELEALLGDD